MTKRRVVQKNTPFDNFTTETWYRFDDDDIEEVLIEKKVTMFYKKTGKTYLHEHWYAEGDEFYFITYDCTIEIDTGKLTMASKDISYWDGTRIGRNKRTEYYNKDGSLRSCKDYD